MKYPLIRETQNWRVFLKISLGKYFHSNPEIPQVNVVLRVSVERNLVHILVKIRQKVLLLSAGNIQAEIFNRLSRSIRQELTKNAVKKELKTSILVFPYLCMISKSPKFRSFD